MMSPPPESNVERMLGLKIMTLEQRLAAVEQFVESRFCETFRDFASRTAGVRLCEKARFSDKQEEGEQLVGAAVAADEHSATNPASPNKAAAERAGVEKPVARQRQAAREKRVILYKKSSKGGLIPSPAARTKVRRCVPPPDNEVVVLSSDSEKDGKDDDEKGIDKPESGRAGVKKGQEAPRLPQNGEDVQVDGMAEMTSAEEGAGSYRPLPARRKRKAKSKASSYSRWRKRFVRKKEPAAGPQDKSFTFASSTLCDPGQAEPWPAADDPNCQNSNQPKQEEMERSAQAMEVEGDMKTYEFTQSPEPPPTPPQSNDDGFTEMASLMDAGVMSGEHEPPNSVLKEDEDADSEYRCAEEELSNLSENCPALPIEEAGDMSWETPMSLIQAICSAIVIEEGEESWGSGASPPKIYARLDGEDDDKSSVTAMASNSPTACVELDEDLAMIAHAEHVSQTSDLCEREEAEGGTAESGACTGDSDSVPYSPSADPFAERKCRIRIFYCPACQGGFKCKEELEEHRRTTHLDSDDEKKEEDTLEGAVLGDECCERTCTSPARKKQRKLARKQHRRHLKRKRERRAAREEQLPGKGDCEHMPEQDSGVTSDSSSLSQGKSVGEQEVIGRQQADVSSSERVKRPYRKRQRNAGPVANGRRRGRPPVTLPEDGLLICIFEDCGYIPDNEKEYRAHLRVHPLKHAVSCPVCERKFIERLNLEEHLKSHRKCVPHDVTMISIKKSRTLQPSVILQRLPL